MINISVISDVYVDVQDIYMIVEKQIHNVKCITCTSGNVNRYNSVFF